MKDRVLSGVTLVAFFMAIVVFNRSFPLALNIAIAFISALAVFEVIKALELSDRWYITVPGMTAAVLVQFCEFQQANIFIYSAFTACIFCALLRHHREITFKEMAVVYSMVVLIPLALQTYRSGAHVERPARHVLRARVRILRMDSGRRRVFRRQTLR